MKLVLNTLKNHPIRLFFILLIVWFNLVPYYGISKGIISDLFRAGNDQDFNWLLLYLTSLVSEVFAYKSIKSATLLIKVAILATLSRSIFTHLVGLIPIRYELTFLNLQIENFWIYQIIFNHLLACLCGVTVHHIVKSFGDNDLEESKS